MVSDRQKLRETEEQVYAYYRQFPPGTHVPLTTWLKGAWAQIDRLIRSVEG